MGQFPEVDPNLDLPALDARVDRKGGWDCHGLPVELEVEKELGLKDKQAIETYGVEAFNARCRESVERYVDAFEQLTERIGFWIDTSQAYRTMDTAYVESVWWALAELYRRGLLVEDYKVSPYCPRCQTTLSDAEVAMGYQEVEDLTAYVALPATSGRVAREAVARAVGQDATVLRPVPPEELLGTRYRRAFDLVPITDEEAARGWTV